MAIKGLCVCCVSVCACTHAGVYVCTGCCAYVHFPVKWEGCVCVCACACDDRNPYGCYFWSMSPSRQAQGGLWACPPQSCPPPRDTNSPTSQFSSFCCAHLCTAKVRAIPASQSGRGQAKLSGLKGQQALKSPQKLSPRKGGLIGHYDKAKQGGESARGHKKVYT